MSGDVTPKKALDRSSGMRLPLTRRRFLQGMAAAAGAVAFTGCQAADPSEFTIRSRVRLAEDILSAYDEWYGTTCRMCQAGCGTVVRVIEGRAKKVEGNIDHPVNRGKLCARGHAGLQAMYHPDRIQGPLRRVGARGEGAFEPLTWDDALDELVQRLRPLQESGRGGEVAVLTEPVRAHRGLLLERFTGELGAAWLALDPLPELPVHAAVERVLGTELLPAFDIRNARYLLSFGADFLGTWLSPVHYGVEYGIFRQGNYYPEAFDPRQHPRGYFVQIEPRFSTTAANADEWVPIRPGAEGFLALGMISTILAEGLGDPAATALFGGAEVWQSYAPEQTADITGVAPERVRELARAFATQQPSLAMGGGPASGQTNGTPNVSAVMALNVLVGAIGRPGGVLFNERPPIRELPIGLRPSSLREWEAMVDALRARRVSTVLVHDANPAYGLPEALGFREALIEAPHVVSFSSFLDDTTMFADLVLPSHVYLEDWGDDVPSPGPGFPVLTMQQPVVRPMYDTRSFWDLLLVLGEEIGGPVQAALPWPTFKDLIREGARDLARQPTGQVDPIEFERFWLQLLQQGGWWDTAAVVAPPPPPAEAPLRELASDFPRPIFAGSEDEYPFHLIVFPHHTLGTGGTAFSPWLQAAPDPVTTVAWQPWVELNPRTAAQLGLKEGDLVVVETPHGQVEIGVYVLPAARPDVLAIPLGHGHRGYGRWTDRRGVNPMNLLAPLVDETTGALAYGATRARLIPTGRHVELPKLEGMVPARQLPDEKVVQTTSEV